jgi:hypothetical protein
LLLLDLDGRSESSAHISEHRSTQEISSCNTTSSSAPAPSARDRRLLAAGGTPSPSSPAAAPGPTIRSITKVRRPTRPTPTPSRVATGAAAIYNCANPPYHRWPTDWPPIHQALMAAAERTGAVLVMTDNLYVFGPGSSMPMRETTR